MAADEQKTLHLNGRAFNFVFRPSTPDKPLLVVLHGHSKTPSPSKLKMDNVNILCPIDNFGLNGYGSWYLGEHGDYFWIDAMKRIIADVYSGSEIYFIGSSMGGYGSILHGAMNDARGIYANIPQTRLLGSTYSSQGMRKYFEYIFGNNKSSEYNDLKNMIPYGCRTYFDITSIRWDKPKYLQEQALEFVSLLTKMDAAFSFEVVNTKGHGLVMPLYAAAHRILDRVQQHDDIKELQ